MVKYNFIFKKVFNLIIIFLRVFFFIIFKGKVRVVLYFFGIFLGRL